MDRHIRDKKNVSWSPLVRPHYHDKVNNAPVLWACIQVFILQIKTATIHPGSCTCCAGAVDVIMSIPWQCCAFLAGRREFFPATI